MMRGAELDDRRFREALGSYASGVTIVSAMLEDGPIGFTCQSFYSVSLNPPLVSISVMRSSSRWPRLRSAGKFAINVLSAQQAEISNALGRSVPDAWSAFSWRVGSDGNPLILDALLALNCTIHSEHAAGDHYIVVANVVDIVDPTSAGNDRHPLIFFRGRYRELARDWAS